MEADVGSVKRIRAVASGPHGRDRHLHVREIAFRRPLGRKHSDVDLQRAPHLEQVEQRARIPANRALEEIADQRAVRRGNSRPAPLRDLEEPPRLQAPGRLADGQATDAERLGELALRRERVARLEAVEDQALQLLDHGVEEGAASNRVDLLEWQRFVSHAGGKIPRPGRLLVLTPPNISDRLAG